MQADILIPDSVKKLILPQLTPVFTQGRQMNEIQNRPDMPTVLSFSNKAPKEACVRKPPLPLSSPEHPFFCFWCYAQGLLGYLPTQTTLPSTLYHEVQAISKAGCARMESLQHFSFKASILQLGPCKQKGPPA